jgi:hypothetical protein
MRNVSRAALLAAACWTIGTGSASAIPVMWQASGVIEHMLDTEPFGDLDAITLGTPWTLELSFDSDAPGILSPLSTPGMPPTYIYEDAVSARFVLGTFEYTSLGDIFVNADLPVYGTSTPDGKPGLVQFQMMNRWLGGAGGPDLNAGAGLMLASYNDANAVDGSLPSVPVWSAEQGLFHGLLWTTLGGYPGAEFSSSFNPVAVPEPTSLLLFGTGLALLAFRRRTRTLR